MTLQEQENDFLKWLDKIQPDLDKGFPYEHGFHDAIKVVKDHFALNSGQIFQQDTNKVGEKRLILGNLLINS